MRSSTCTVMGFESAVPDPRFRGTQPPFATYVMCNNAENKYFKITKANKHKRHKEPQNRVFGRVNVQGPVRRICQLVLKGILVLIGLKESRVKLQNSHYAKAIF